MTVRGTELRAVANTEFGERHLIEVRQQVFDPTRLLGALIWGAFHSPPIRTTGVYIRTSEFFEVHSCDVYQEVFDMSTRVVQNSCMDERITRAEAARRLGVSYQTIVRMVKRGQLREWSNETGTIHRLSSAEVDSVLKQK